MRCLIALFILVGLAAVGSRIACAGAAEQPESVAPGDPAHDIEESYTATQTSRGVTDKDRIRSAIGAYLTAKARSLVQGKALDLAFVIDRSTPDGRNLYNYELGRLEYTLACWRYADTPLVLTECIYTPAYYLIDIRGDTATVSLSLSGQFRYADTSHIDQFSGQGHTMVLVRREGQWKLVDDQYEDEFTNLYPRGTDFAALQRLLAERAAQQATGKNSAGGRSGSTSPANAVLWLLAVCSATGGVGVLTWIYVSRRRFRSRHHNDAIQP